MMRTQTQYFRPGPRFAAVTAAFILPIMLVVYLQEKKIVSINEAKKIRKYDFQ